MIREGYQAPKCVCGHVAGEHKSGSRSLSATAKRYGICLRDGCGCREFVQAGQLEGGDRA